jgi:hypothetical protein
VYSTTWVLNTLRRVCAELAATHPEFAGIRFTPQQLVRAGSAGGPQVRRSE